MDEVFLTDLLGKKEADVVTLLSPSGSTLSTTDRRGGPVAQRSRVAFFGETPFPLSKSTTFADGGARSKQGAGLITPCFTSATLPSPPLTSVTCVTGCWQIPSGFAATVTLGRALGYSQILRETRHPPRSAGGPTSAIKQ
jgi:hypothetical protein